MTSPIISSITHAIKADEHLENLDPIELDLFLGDNYLVTCSSDAQVTAVENLGANPARQPPL